jgi:hypothetical protein
VPTGHENAYPCAAASGLDAPWERPVAPGRVMTSPDQGRAIRTLLAIVGLVGLFCTTLPDGTYGGASQAG